VSQSASIKPFIKEGARVYSKHNVKCSRFSHKFHSNNNREGCKHM